MDHLEAKETIARFAAHAYPVADSLRSTGSTWDFYAKNTNTYAHEAGHLMGLPDDYYATYADQVRGATDASVNAAAKKFVNNGQTVWVVIGDRAKVEAGIRELGVGDIVFLDADGRPKDATP